MGLLTFLAIAGVHVQQPAPILWLAPSGQIEVAGRPVKARLTPGASRVRLPGGYVYNFTGVHGGVLIDDLAPLHLTGSMTVSLWIDLRSYVNDGPGAQILFRGDDRCGVDPYALTIHGDGTIGFGVQDEQDRGFGVSAEIPLSRWIHVTASFDGKTGELNMWLNQEHVAYAKTSRRPFDRLDAAYAPGIGIGNVQNDHGPHNQPLNGMIGDLRLYDRAIRGEDLDFGPAPWDASSQQLRSEKITVH